MQVHSTGMARLLAMSTAIGSTLIILSVGLRIPTVQADAVGADATLRTVLQRDTPSSFLSAAYNCPRRRATSDGSFRATGEIVAPDASGAYRPIGTFVETGTFTLDWADAALPWPELTNLRTTFTLTFADGSGLRGEGAREGSGGSCDHWFRADGEVISALSIRARGLYRVTFYDAQGQDIATESGRSRLILHDEWPKPLVWFEEVPPATFRYLGEFYVPPPR